MYHSQKSEASPPADSNPFATRYIQPGLIPFRFNTWGDDHEPHADRLEQLVADLDSTTWQIVGPHGSGKTTLLIELIRFLHAHGRPVESFELHDGQRRLSQRTQHSDWDDTTVVTVDGYEQLGYWAKWRLQRLCRKRKACLIVTTHRDQGFKTLWRTETNLQLLRQIVGQLTEKHSRRPSVEQIESAFHATEGNVREALFRLYDVVQ